MRKIMFFIKKMNVLSKKIFIIFQIQMIINIFIYFTHSNLTLIIKFFKYILEHINRYFKI